jgi:hypothetical protein
LHLRFPIGEVEDFYVQGLDNLEENLNIDNRERIENELIPIAKKYILSNPLVLEGDDNEVVVNQSIDTFLANNDKCVDIM